MNQVGFDQSWMEFLRLFVRPLQELIFTGYYHDVYIFFFGFAWLIIMFSVCSFNFHYPFSTYLFILPTWRLILLPLLFRTNPKDSRIEGGYENVPTRDIHLKQVGLASLWDEFLTFYISPLQQSVFIGYDDVSSSWWFIVSLAAWEGDGTITSVIIFPHLS